MKRIAVILSFLLLMGCTKAEAPKYADIRTLPEDYGSWDNRQEAIDDGVVVYSFQEVSNIEALDSFVENVSRGKSSSLRILRYTIEGSPIITDVTYEKLKTTGDRFAVTVDTTRDSFSGFGNIEISYWAYLCELEDAANISNLLPYASSKTQVLFDDSFSSPPRHYSPDGCWLVERSSGKTLTAKSTDGSKLQLELDRAGQITFDDQSLVCILQNDSRLFWDLSSNTTSTSPYTMPEVQVLASQCRELLEGDGWIGPGTHWWQVSESFVITGADGLPVDIQYKYVLRLNFRNSETQEDTFFYFNGNTGEYLGRK